MLKAIFQKHFLIGCIALTICTLPCQGQGINTLLEQYIELCRNNMDAKDIYLQTATSYEKLKTKEKAAFKDKLMNEIISTLKEEQKGISLSLISLYKTIATENDSKLGDLYYAEGCIRAEERDTINLKFCINNLRTYAAKAQKNYDTDIETLNTVLTKMCRRNNLMSELNGHWTSTNLYASTEIADTHMYSYQPWIAARVTAPNRTDNQTAGTEVVTTIGGTPLQKSHHQIFLPYADDSLYICWSTENLMNFSPEVAGQMRQLSALGSSCAAAAMVDRNSGIGERVAAQAVGGLIEIGVGLIIDAIFQPRKEIHVFEMRLKVGENELTGTAIHHFASGVGDNPITKYDVNTTEVKLIRWDNSWPIEFLQDRKNGDMFISIIPPYTPVYMVDDANKAVGETESTITDLLTKTMYYMNNLMHPDVYQEGLEFVKHGSKIKRSKYCIDTKIAAWNIIMYTKMMRLHHQREYDRKKALGEDDQQLWKQIHEASLGINGIHVDTTDPMYAGIAAKNGVQITDMAYGSAMIAGLGVGDIISTIDGKPVDYIEDILRIMGQHHIGDTITIQYVMAKKRNLTTKKIIIY